MVSSYSLQIRSSLKGKLNNERSGGDALIHKPMAFPLYEAVTCVKYMTMTIAMTMTITITITITMVNVWEALPVSSNRFNCP